VLSRPRLTVFADDTSILKRTGGAAQLIEITETGYDLAMLLTTGEESMNTALQHNEPAMRAALTSFQAAAEICM
jgi:hypothetical protein